MSIRCRTCNNATRRTVEKTPEGYKEYHKEYKRQSRRTEEGKRITRASNLKKFGLTPEEYDDLLSVQNGVCWICKNPETAKNQYGPLRLAVDHNHITGKIRKLLCMRCNRAIGMLKEDIDVLQKIIDYLKEYK